ncbi:MAG: Sec-independent protein translocase protein TatB [Candidatus Accumulibacter sp.]|jgi:sec-independent protein translocase protein TatB|nr:Sec-independent protein translocase protein TatB [Accumulibacter sp.]
MFDIGFSELIVIGVVALVVIGPERLPRVARTAGVLLGRLQRYVSDVKADISREMQLDELKKLQAEVRESARDFERGMTEEARRFEQTVDSLKAGVQAAAAPASGAAPAADGEPAAPPPREEPPSAKE